MTVPQAYLCDPEELALQLGGDQKEREIFIPLFISLGLPVLGATGAALTQTHHTGWCLPG